MTGRSATMAMDSNPISQADLARIREEERLHAERQRLAARVVAASAKDVADARMLLEILGLDQDVVLAARGPRTKTAPRTSPTSRRRSRAA